MRLGDSMWEAAAFWYFIASRLAYVLWVGWALRQQDRTRRFTRERGAEAGFLRFRRMASILMNNDGVGFVALVLLSGNTLALELPRWGVLIAGGLMVVAGVGIKLWAAASLGAKAYYWHNFFAPDDPIPSEPAGPYRYVRNPMYTFGYLQTYGLALLFSSLPALIASAFAQAAVLVFNHVVERPHYAELMRQARAQEAS